MVSIFINEGRGAGGISDFPIAIQLRGNRALFSPGPLGAAIIRYCFQVTYKQNKIILKWAFGIVILAGRLRVDTKCGVYLLDFVTSIQNFENFLTKFGDVGFVHTILGCMVNIANFQDL